MAPARSGHSSYPGCMIPVLAYDLEPRTVEMFQFAQDVDTSQSVTLKAHECTAAFIGIVTGEAQSGS